jgi:hypothetical protein
MVNSNTDIFKQLKIIFLTLVTGQIIYFLISLILVIDEMVDLDKDFSTIWGFIIPVIVVIMVVASRLLYNYMINTNLDGTSEEQKQNIYKTGNLIKYVLLESANLLSITFYLLTGDFLYLGMFIIVLGIFLINIPGKDKFLTEFGLTSIEE